MEKETAAPAPPQDAREELRAVQIRDRLHAMDRSARPLAISASMKAGDDSVVAAVSAPDFVSGLEAAEHSFVSEEWGRTRFPEKCARLDSVRRAFNHLERGGSLLLSFSRRLYDARIVEQGEASERAAQKALEAISKYRGFSRRALVAR